MFGRSYIAFQNTNPQPTNNGIMFKPNAYRQTNLLNIQYQNPTFNYNYNQKIPNFQNQFPIINQNSEIHNDSTQNSTEFDLKLQESQQFTENSIAKSSKSTYNEAISVYEEAMHKLNTNPYPINVEKLKVFITFQAKWNDN